MAGTRARSAANMDSKAWEEQEQLLGPSAAAKGGGKVPLYNARRGALISVARALCSKDPPHDVFFAAALFTLLLVVLVREALTMGALILASLAWAPWAALGLLPLLALCSAVALLGCYILLSWLRGMTPWGLQVYSVVLVVLFGLLGLGSVLSWAGSSSTSGASSVQPGLGNAFTLLVVAGLSAVALFPCSEHRSMVATLVSDTATFLVTRGRVVVALLLAVGFVEGALFTLPLVSLASATGAAVAADCSQPAGAAFFIGMDLKDKLASKLQAHTLQAADFEPVLAPFKTDAACKAWVSALAVFQAPSSMAFTALSVLLLAWLLVLFEFICIFLSCTLVRQGLLEAADGSPTFDVRGALRNCFVDSLGSLCLASLVSTIILGLHLLLSLVAVSSFAAPVLVPVEFLLYISAIMFVYMLVVPGLATFGTSFRATWHSVATLLSKKFIQVVSIPLFLMPVSLLLAVPITLVLVLVGALGSGLIAPLVSPALFVPFMWIGVLGPILQVSLFSEVFSTTISCSFIKASAQNSSEEDTGVDSFATAAV